MGLPSRAVGVRVWKFYDGGQRDLSESGYFLSGTGHYRCGRARLLRRLEEIDIEKVMTQNIKNGTFYGTTVVSVRHLGNTVMAGDGQVTLGATVVKQGASKVRQTTLALQSTVPELSLFPTKRMEWQCLEY